MKIPTKFYSYPGAYGLLQRKEVPIYLNEYTDEQRKRHEADKFAKVFVLQGISDEISIQLDCTATTKQMWDQLENKSKLSSKEKLAASVECYEEKIKSLEDSNVELLKKISDLEQTMVKERFDFDSKKKEFAKKFSEFSKKSFEEKKIVELKCIKLSQQIYDFEKVIILEREKFVKEKKEIQQKNVGFFKEISSQRKDAEKGFEEERTMFEAEIRKLTVKLSELSESALKEKKTKA
ncbi:hypothetical protein L6452_15452 [Arctium lappa]|uniref:Uncharacterized protein n=1 Tax=Arctium lappa TaxID=4217 RepID=A0ACB9CNU6_ARCLA|nr:hypothetical protein L6452_15452 [Arctium lappa]